MSEKTRELYPLSPAQRIFFYTVKFCPKKQVLNIGTSLTIKEDIDFDLLKTSIYEAYARCESMRLRFVTQEDGQTMQYVAEKEERDIEYYDFRNNTMEEAEKIMTDWTKTPFERENSPLNRVVMIDMSDGYKGIYFLADHMTMDAQALIVYLKDIIEIYCSKKYEGFEYPKEMGSYIEQLKKDLAYEKGCKAKDKDTKFFENLIKESEPIYCDVEGKDRLLKYREQSGNKDARACRVVSTSVDANIGVFHLEADASNRLLEFCIENGVPMVCLLMMGLRTFLQKFNEQDDVSINSTVARRATLLQKKSGGTRIHFFPCRTIVKRDESFIDGIKKIQEGQNKIFMHANYDPIVYRATRDKVYQNEAGMAYEPMSLTYQPMTLKSKSGALGEANIEYKTKWYTNGVAAQALYLTVMHRTKDNGLDFSFEYQTGAITEEKLEYVYYYLCKILFAGIENPDIKIGDLIDKV